MSDLELTALPLEGLFILHHRVREDERGRFARIFCQGSLERAGLAIDLRQINHSRTHQVGAVRGLHFQYPPFAETKIISCLRGAVWDVAVDLRWGSKTFLRWHAERLGADDGRALLLPPGFAHGFQVLEPDTELLYLHDVDYAPDKEGGLCPTDPRLQIPWPLPITQLSPRDSAHPLLLPSFEGIAP
jgi:dTDP-4-dehydrorhamnose 3,5-epimerase